MSTSKNLKLTTWLGGLLAPRFLSTGLAVVVTAVLLPAGKRAAWDGDRGDNEGVAGRGGGRAAQTVPGPRALNKPTGGQQCSLDHSSGRQHRRAIYTPPRSYCVHV